MDMFVVCIVIALDMLFLMPYHLPAWSFNAFPILNAVLVSFLHGIPFFPSFVFLYSFTVLSSAAIVAITAHIPVSFDFSQKNPVT